ncbi:MAG: LysR family transcriptional regulator [Proteobacteria bacterium]|nr:LysR family transcriptional regulator [Pseudomonadota bacterium]
MYLEFRHLRTIKAIHDQGGLARAASVLNITQSALSHQVKALEEQVGMELFLRRSKPLKLSKAGHKLLKLADEILPRVHALEVDFAEVIDGKAGRLHIAIECHACFDWLFPVLEQFRKSWGQVDVDIRPSLAFDALPALQREEVDVAISDDPEAIDGITFIPLFDYEPTFICATDHPLAKKDYIVAEDLRGETLITYPEDKTRLDVYTELLTPAKIEPKTLRQIELTAVIMLLVASNRGVSVLPDWVVANEQYGHDFATKRITKNGLSRRLYAAVRDADIKLGYIIDFVNYTKAQARR